MACDSLNAFSGKLVPALRFGPVIRKKHHRGRCVLQICAWIPSYGIVVVSVTGRNVNFAESE